MSDDDPTWAVVVFGYPLFAIAGLMMFGVAVAAIAFVWQDPLFHGAVLLFALWMVGLVIYGITRQQT